MLKMSATIAALLASFFFRYYFAPYEVQIGGASSRTWFSWTEFQVYSVITLLIGVPLMFWSRIVLRLAIEPDNNKLSIDIINRFRWSKKTRTVLLSQTQIQIDHHEATDYKFRRNYPEYSMLYLINPEFGTVLISSRDFGNLDEIVKHFEQLRSDTAKKIRSRRAGKRSVS